MKILIQENKDNINTKFHYIGRIVAAAENVNAQAWMEKDLHRVYDVLDTVQPDMLILGYENLNPDIVEYLSQSDISLVLDVTNIKAQNLKELESIVEENNINCKLLITEKKEHESKINTFELSACADVVTPYSDPVDYKVEALLISETEDFDKSLLSKFNSYHTCYAPSSLVVPINAPDLTPVYDFDFLLNSNQLIGLYNKYDHVIINGSLEYCTSQIFFDATLRAKKVTLKYPEKDKERFIDFLKSTFVEFSEEPSSEQVKQQIQFNHTCINRVMQMLIALDMKEQAQSLSARLGGGQ